MKRYQFTLATVLRARQAQEQLARASLMLAHQAAHRAAEAVAESRAHYESAAVPTGGGFMAQRELWELAGQAVVQAQQAEAEAQATVASAMTGYLDAARAVSVIEHLDERRREEHALAAQREEANSVDELVTSRYGRDRARRQGPAAAGNVGSGEEGAEP